MGGGTAIALSAALLLGMTSASAAKLPASDGRRLAVDFDPGGTIEPPVQHPEHRVLYVNRHGGTFVAGSADDSGENKSVLVDAGSKVVPPFDWGDAKWNEVMACVREKYSPYAITVTDTEPPAGSTYVEAVVGGTQEDIGYAGPGGGGDVLGVASTMGCQIVEKGVSYSFAAAHPRGEGDAVFLCGTVLQESAHQFGMEHALNADDAMTYLSPSSQWPQFTDADSQCGEYEPRSCRCGGSTQNSHEWLLAVLGPADAVPPTITLDSPADGATVQAPITVESTASDNNRIDRVELLVDGQVLTTKDDPPFNFEVPRGVHSGGHTLTVRAVDGDENAVEASVDVTIEAECSTDDQCGEAQTCDVDICLGGVGADCENPSQCAGGICFVDTTEGISYCTEECVPDSDNCPSGSKCVQPEFGTPKCVPGADGGGGGCAAGGGRGSRGAAGMMLLGVLGLAIAARRRRPA